MYRVIKFLCILLIASGCGVPAATMKTANTEVPGSYGAGTDTADSGDWKWRQFFTDPDLVKLIDSGLRHNQELMINLQENEIAKNEILFRQARIMPAVSGRLAAGVEKVGRYTSQGAGDASTDMLPGKEVPDPLSDLFVGIYSNWEVDIWRKLRNSRKAAVTRYLSTLEGRNFVITTLIAEIANSYYELVALDNQLDIVRENIALQKNALEIVKAQKEAARATELAVKKFEAEVSKSGSLEYDILQQIKETELQLNFLLGRYPQEIHRNKNGLTDIVSKVVNPGIPSQLLSNRPDIRKAELDLQAAKLDLKVARAEFYPSFEISAGVGFQAFKPAYLFKSPESLLFDLAGDLVAPIINRNAIKAEFNSANARQLQAIYNYERTILNAFLEVSTQLSNISNLEQGYQLKLGQVNALTQSIEISNNLFMSARADYLEVLMTQRDALEAKLELIETKKRQMNAVVNIYQALGGGWR